MGTITQINTNGTAHYIASTAYCYCDTGSSTVAKVAKVVGDQADSASSADFTLIKGATIHVKFVYTNTASNPTLNVGGTGAKAIMRYGSSRAGTTKEDSWRSGAIVSFTYDGTNWVMNSGWDNDTTYSSMTELEYGTATSLVTRGDKYRWNHGVSDILKDLAIEETGSTASKDYAVGEYFIRARRLNKVTATLSEGDTITPGTNVELVTVGDELIDAKGIGIKKLVTPRKNVTFTGYYCHFYDFGNEISKDSIIAVYVSYWNSNSCPFGIGLGNRAVYAIGSPNGAVTELEVTIVYTGYITDDELPQQITKSTNVTSSTGSSLGNICNWVYTKYPNGYVNGYGSIACTLPSYTGVGSSGLYGYHCVVTLPETFTGDGASAVANWSIGNGFGFPSSINGNFQTTLGLFGVGNVSGSQAVRIKIFISGMTA